MEGKESAKNQGYGGGNLGTEVPSFTKDPFICLCRGSSNNNN